ncbi:DUF819 family protein [Candidatus Xianfuyuplasma coldseepsis]|uniref:DUF819 family protein n=1 Tax=Candidatus Xianfuyuplasma coldseepsis TaxID=2782163 RepID=A0A7L7KQZ4_9MOLU|nr:DUF819 family protein [Xianfuyuplasma coldseepsis]QMS84228.1 DUF819 family protein [Xianfuyuplasma coldseepsis]
MNIVVAIIQLSLIILVPLFIIRNDKFILTKWFGSIGTAYLAGITLSVLIYLLNRLGVNIVPNKDVGEIGSHLAISIAIPLLLFSANLKEAKKLSKTVLKSFASLLISAVVVSSIVFYAYAYTLADGDVLSGMAIGVYTGGTPNLNAIANIFGLEQNIILSANLSDMIIGALFYVFLLLLAKPLLSRFLRNRSDENYLTEDSSIINFEEIDMRQFTLTKTLWKRVILGFGIAVLGALFGILVWILLGMEDGKMIDLLVPTMMITVTILGIVGSFNKSIRETEGMNVIGQYLILIFSFALASSIDFTQLQSIFTSTLILYGTVTVGVFILHTIISKFLNIDVDCTMITLTAGVYGPAFVPAITKQIKNDDLTAPGLIVGSIGYAVGTFLGMGLVFLYAL